LKVVEQFEAELFGKEGDAAVQVADEQMHVVDGEMGHSYRSIMSD
jgi:hypothetical protein